MSDNRQIKIFDTTLDRAWEALKGAHDPRIHVFLATSAIHREFKLKMSPDEIIERAVAGVKRAKGYCDNIEFSPEDAARTEIDFLCKVVEAVVDAGATTVNIPDTVGYATPEQMGKVIDSLVNRVPNMDKAVRRDRQRGRADRMHDQWYRRTRRKCIARRSRNGNSHS